MFQFFSGLGDQHSTDPPPPQIRPIDVGIASGTNPLSRQAEDDSPLSGNGSQRQQQLSGHSSHPHLPPLPQSFPSLAEKSPEELVDLLTNKEHYLKFLFTIEPVKYLNHVIQDLESGNRDLAKSNLEMEAEINELRTQCRIIRGTELAAAKEKLDTLTKRERELTSKCSPAAFIHQLRDAARVVDEEAEKLHEKLLKGELEPAEFLPKYRELRLQYHRRTQLQYAALNSLTSSLPGPS